MTVTLTYADGRTSDVVVPVTDQLVETRHPQPAAAPCRRRSQISRSAIPRPRQPTLASEDAA